MKLFFGALIIGLCFSAISARAAVVERDWQPVGDGLLTYDTVNKREWLDVPVSLLLQFHPTDVDLAVDTAKTELLPGGTFEGFTFAKRVDVLSLVESVGIVISYDLEDTRTNAVPMRHLIGLLSPTIFSSGDFGFRLTSGVLDEMAIPQVSGDRRYFAAFFQATEPDALSPNGRGFLSILNNDDRHSSQWTGMMLFRNVIPEPSAGFLAILASALFQITRIRRQ